MAQAMLTQCSTKSPKNHLKLKVVIPKPFAPILPKSYSEEDGSSVTYDNRATYPLLGEAVCTVLVDITRSTKQLSSPIQKTAPQYQFANASPRFSAYIPSQDKILFFSSQECHGIYGLPYAIASKPNRSNFINNTVDFDYYSFLKKKIPSDWVIQDISHVTLYFYWSIMSLHVITVFYSTDISTYFIHILY